MPIFCHYGSGSEQDTSSFVVIGRVGLMRDERVMEVPLREKFRSLSDSVYSAPSSFVRADYLINPLPRVFSHSILGMESLSCIDFTLTRFKNYPNDSAQHSDSSARVKGEESSPEVEYKNNNFSSIGQLVASKLI